MQISEGLDLRTHRTRLDVGLGYGVVDVEHDAGLLHDGNGESGTSLHKEWLVITHGSSVNTWNRHQGAGVAVATVRYFNLSAADVPLGFRRGVYERKTFLQHES